MGIEKVGDYIVPRYNDRGTAEGPGTFLGTPAKVNELRNKYEEHANISGALPFRPHKAKGAPPIVVAKLKPEAKPTSTKKAAPRKTPAKGFDLNSPSYAPMEDEVESFQEVEPVVKQLDSEKRARVVEFDEPILPKKKVFISNKFGKTKLSVIGILRSNIDIGIGLIFENEDALTFIPNVGEKITLEFDNESMDVCYTGLLFDWIEGSSKIMILGRVAEEAGEEENSVQEGDK